VATLDNGVQGMVQRLGGPASDMKKEGKIEKNALPEVPKWNRAW
jgi:hypothetical protein